MSKRYTWTENDGETQWGILGTIYPRGGFVQVLPADPIRALDVVNQIKVIFRIDLLIT